MPISKLTSLPFPPPPSPPFSASGQGLVASVNQLIDTSVSSLKALPVNPQTDTVYGVIGFYAGSTVGGGKFVWNPTADKSSHNGITVIAPEALSIWSGTQSTISYLLSWSGSGTGCWIRCTEPLSSSALINVPSDLPTIRSAVLYAMSFRIPVGVTFTIKIADGTYELASGLLINHPDGDRLRLVGNESNESLCIVTTTGGAAPTFDAITVSNGYRLGWINGMTIRVNSRATNYTGILAVNGAFINCGSNLVVENYYYGIAARVGSEILCDGVEVYNAGDVGIWAYVGSTIRCNNAISNGAIDIPNNLGFGIQAEFGSVIECTGASTSGCRISGIASLSNSLVRAHNCTASTNAGSGFYASADGHIENHNSVANNNSRYGEERVLGGTISGNSVTLSGNTLGSVSGYAYFDNSGALGARIAANGDLRIDVSGANNIYFNSSGGVQAQVAHTAAANSWTLQRASAAGQPAIEAAGGSANIDYNIKPKGTGRVFLASQRPNFVAVNGATPGQPPTVSPEGADANIDLQLNPKGSGLVRFGSMTASTDAPVIGYIEIKDASGTIRRLAVIA